MRERKSKASKRPEDYAHEKGFEDAVLASPESEAFVQDTLETIANLEGELIRRE